MQAVLGKLLFKSNLLQLLLHFKSSKLLYTLVYRYFITSNSDPNHSPNAKP